MLTASNVHVVCTQTHTNTYTCLSLRCFLLDDGWIKSAFFMDVMDLKNETVQVQKRCLLEFAGASKLLLGKSLQGQADATLQKLSEGCGTIKPSVSDNSKEELTKEAMVAAGEGATWSAGHGWVPVDHNDTQGVIRRRRNVDETHQFAVTDAAEASRVVQLDTRPGAEETSPTSAGEVLFKQEQEKINEAVVSTSSGTDPNDSNVIATDDGVDEHTPLPGETPIGQSQQT